jgi:hypothetical protein
MSERWKWERYTPLEGESPQVYFATEFSFKNYKIKFNNKNINWDLFYKDERISSHGLPKNAKVAAKKDWMLFRYFVESVCEGIPKIRESMKR